MSYLSPEFRARLLALTPDGRRRLVATLEGRPCPKSCRCRMHLIPVGCDYLPDAVRSLGKPCKHVLRHDHHLSGQQWAELLALVGDGTDEEGTAETYREPPLPLTPAHLVTRTGRLATLIRRQADHENLRDPDDSYEQDRIGEAGAPGSPSGENAYGSGAPILDAETSRPRPPPAPGCAACMCRLCRLARLHPEGGVPCSH